MEHCLENATLKVMPVYKNEIPYLAILTYKEESSPFLQI